MIHLEDELKAALARVEPGEGFADSVLARIEAPRDIVVPIRAKRRRLVMAFAAAAAAGALVFGTAWAYTNRASEAPALREVVHTPVPPPIVPDARTGDGGPAIPPDLAVINRGPARVWGSGSRTVRRTGAASGPTAEEQRAANDLRTAIAITREKLATARRASQPKTIEIPAS